jgi:glutamyl-tRNA synthetase
MVDKKEIKRYVLDNAINYGGKANFKAVTGHLIGKYPEVKEDMGKFIRELQDIVKKVNSMSLEDQKKELEKSGAVLKAPKKEAGLFDFLNVKKGEKIITAFPPGPEKYPHIGHAKALFLNYLLAKEYGGKFYLRFEDTNPELVENKYYKIMLDNFKWLGVKWDKLQYASDHMELYYKLGEKLIRENQAYVCYCKGDSMKKNRRKGVPCECRNVDSSQNLRNWLDFFKAKARSCIVRLKGDMTHKNAMLRDPALFRIITKSHPRTKKKYRVWPTYDFQNSIMDGYFGVTHRLRGKEFEPMSELQKYLQKLLGLTVTQTFEFARFNMKGIVSSGRIIRDKIKKRQLTGWDDPRLTTIVALRRRGFLPEAIKNFVVGTGISKSEGTLTWDDLFVKSRKLMDDTANRYFFVENPKKIKIEGIKNKTVKIPLHPSHDRGERILKTKKEFYVSDKISKNKNYRFMHLFNFKNGKYISEALDKNLKAQLIHWLPVSKDLAKVRVLMDDNKYISGLAESAVKKLKVGDIVQFERMFFARLDKKSKDKLDFIYTHR